MPRADCDRRGPSLLQLQRKQKTKDGGEVKHQNHFCCTITCGYCGKCRHYEYECHIKRRESEKHNKAEEEGKRTLVKVTPRAVAVILGDPPVRVTLEEDKVPQHPRLVEEEHPT